MTEEKKDTLHTIEDVEKSVRQQCGDEIDEVSITVSEKELARGLQDYAGTYSISRNEYIGVLQPKIMMNAQILLNMMQMYMGGLEEGYKKIQQFNQDGYITPDNVDDYFNTQKKIIEGHNKLTDTLVKLETVSTKVYENFNETDRKQELEFDKIIDGLVKIIYNILMKEVNPDDRDKYRILVQAILGEMRDDI